MDRVVLLVLDAILVGGLAVVLTYLFLERGAKSKNRTARENAAQRIMASHTSPPCCIFSAHHESEQNAKRNC